MRTLILTSVAALCLCLGGGCGKHGGGGCQSITDPRVAELTQERDRALDQAAKEAASKKNWQLLAFAAAGGGVLLFLVGAAVGGLSRGGSRQEEGRRHVDTSSEAPRWD